MKINVATPTWHVMNLLLFIASHAAFGQINFQPALIVNNRGDSISGFIDHQDWSRCPDDIAFRRTLEGVTENYTPADLRYFKVENESYTQYMGPISMDINSTRVASVPEFPRKVDTVWFKVIRKGNPLSLYQYRDNIKNRYFVAFRDEFPEELIYRSYPAGGDDVRFMVADDRYKYQLKNMTLRFGEMGQKVKFKIDKATYGTRSLEEVVYLINGPDANGPGQYKRKNPGHFSLGAGVNITHLRIVHSFVGYVQSSTTASPYLSANFDIPGNPDVGKLVFRAGISFNSVVLQAQGGQDTTFYQVNTRQTTVTVTPQLMYNFFNSKKLKTYVGAGLRFNVSGYQTTFGYSDLGANITPIWLQSNLQVGAIYKERFEAMVTWAPQLSQMISRFERWGNSVDFILIGFGYHFVKPK